MRWPLDPKPSYFLEYSVFFVLFEGVRDEVQLTSHYTLLICFVCFFFFLFCFLRDKTVVPPENRTFLLVCSVSPLVSPRPFFTTPFDSLSLCLLLLLSLLSLLSFYLSLGSMRIHMKQDNMKETHRITKKEKTQESKKTVYIKPDPVML